MAEVIKMPLLSDTMQEGVVAAWHKKTGDSVKSGDLLAEIETDKATMDFESPASGVLLYAGVEAGKGIPVGQILAIIGKQGEDISALLGGVAAKSPVAVPAKAAAPAAETPASTPVSAPVAVPAAPATESEDRLKASPLAKAMARELGISLDQVSGSGENGRIVKRDIEALKEAPPAAAAAAPAQGAPGDYEDIMLSQMRKTIARRLADSKFSAPHFYLTMEIDMERAISTRKSLNELSEVKISFNDMVVKAAAVALRQHPYVNASWLGDRIRLNKSINIGVAVAVDEGLLVPVIRNADQKGLSTISSETKTLAARARDRKLQPQEWEGNTFTISNLGMFGIESFTAIINPPDACIMAVGGIIEKPVVKDGQVVPGSRMQVTLSCDHRVVDGAVGAAFLQSFKALLEDPLKMLL